MNYTDSNTGNSFSSSLYKQELTDLKIEKLGNKITIISIILPCLIGAILVYAYIDISSRVVDAKDSGQNEIQVIAQDMEAKINAMDVNLAKIKFNLDQEIPALTAQLEELSVLKADRKEILAELTALKKEVESTRNQYQGAIHIIDRTSRENLAIINKTGKRLQENAKAFQDQVSSRLVEQETAFNQRLETLQQGMAQDLSRMEDLNISLASYQQTLTTLGKDLEMIREDVTQALDDKLVHKVDEAEMSRQLSAVSQILEKKIADLEASLNRRMTRIEKEAKQRPATPTAAGQVPAVKRTSPELKPKPSGTTNGTPVIIEVPASGGISEGDLIQ